MEEWAARLRDFFLQEAIARTAEGEAGWERDRLIGNANSFSQVFRYYRAGGDCICRLCGLSFYDHPVIRGPEKWHYQCELHVLCNTDRVKL